MLWTGVMTSCALYLISALRSTLKYQTFEPVDAAVPADTKKIELKEKETEITHAVAPLAYSAVVPSLYNYNYPYGVPALRSPYFYHL